MPARIVRAIQAINHRRLAHRRARRVSQWACWAIEGDADDVLDVAARLRPVAIQHPLVRIGGGGDGGYLVPDDLEGITACFSPGVGHTAQFEVDLVTRFGIPCYLADASVVPPSFDPAIAALIDFENIFIGRGETPDVLRLEDWLRKTGRQDDSDLLLQMDIEGGEYDVLADTPRDVLRQFRILVIEFHSLHLLFAEAWRCHMRSLVDALTRDFHVVHIHPNNYAPVFAAHGLEIPDVMEITFLRKDRSQNTGPAGRFPHPLDDPCSPSRPDIVLPALFRGPTGQGPE